MIVLNALLFFAFLILYIFTRSFKTIFFELNQKEHPLHLFYPISYFLIFFTPLKGIFYKNVDQLEQLRSLYTRNNPEEMKLFHWCRKISLIILIILMFNGISLCSFISSTKDQNLFEGRYINRPDYTEQEKEVELEVVIEDGKRNIEQSLLLEVEERKYNAHELEAMFNKTEQYIDKVFLGENASKDKIISPLNLVKRMPGTAITIEWDLGSEELIGVDGTLHNEKIKGSGNLTEIKAIMKYGKTQVEYTFSIWIMPKVVEEEVQVYQNLLEKVKQIQENSLTDRKLILPDEVDDHSVRFAEVKNSKGTNLLLIGIILAVVMGYVVDKDIHKKMYHRELELLMDYPEIMNKFSLLLGAGMTIKNAWGRIAGEYNDKFGGDEKKRRYAYEELLITWRQLNNGVTEVTAFDNFGKRIKLMPYLKFSSLISQNLRKGSKGLLELLELEAVDAFADRKELAKRLGEEAGTKLLFPMMLMLLIVLFLIMIPAFMTL